MRCYKTLNLKPRNSLETCLLKKTTQTYVWSMQIVLTFLNNLFRVTGGHFACACVNPPNDNSVGAANLMAGNRKLAPLKAISLVL